MKMAALREQLALPLDPEEHFHQDAGSASLEEQMFLPVPAAENKELLS